MLSRVADSLYWMRRYMERADQIARVVGVNLELVLDRAPDDVARLWGRLLTALRSAPSWAQVARAPDGDPLTDLASIEAVASCVAAARENARQIRQYITGEMWERINGVSLALNDPVRRAVWAERPHGYFQIVRDGAALLDAAVNAGLPRDQGWHFLQLGVFLERTGSTARLLTCQMQEARPATASEVALDEQLEWICLLKSCDALELYRRRWGAELRSDRIVRFLISDPLSPRSVRYGLDEIARALTALGTAISNQPRIAVARVVTSAVESAQSGGFDPIAVVSAVSAECDRIHGLVYDTYIDHRRTAAPAASAEAPWLTL
ncbi:MAG TPA: alpha-E domain-containing protein [Gemmatimonadaceae bacterium]|nr:alpha-E domain-containing protein [Gemmatimonadaceae bacterium]